MNYIPRPNVDSTDPYNNDDEELQVVSDYISRLIARHPSISSPDFYTLTIGLSPPSCRVVVDEQQDDDDEEEDDQDDDDRNMDGDNNNSSSRCSLQDTINLESSNLQQRGLPTKSHADERKTKLHLMTQGQQGHDFALPRAKALPWRTRRRTVYLVSGVAFVVLIATLFRGQSSRSRNGNRNDDHPSMAAPLGDTSSNKRKAIQNGNDLRLAIDEYLLLGEETTHHDLGLDRAIGEWDVSLVRDFDSLFDVKRNSLAVHFNDDISNWNVSRAWTTRRMFYGAKKFAGNLSSWHVPRLRDATDMFAQAESFDSDSPWDVSEIHRFRGMFQGATSFKGNSVSMWNTAKARDLSYMFYRAHNFAGDVSQWNVARATNMTGTFAKTKVFNGDLSGWDTSRVESMAYMFAYSSRFDSNLDEWNMTKVHNLQRMFSGASNFSQNLCAWGQSLPARLDVNTAMIFVNSRCPNQKDPHLHKSTPGPFCTSC